MNNVEQFVIEHSDFELPKDELAHHGIEGQKWGVTNGPPYPLSSEKHNNVIKKAAKAVSSAGDAVKKTVRKVEDNVAANKEKKAQEKLESEKRKLKLQQLKAKANAVKEQRDSLKKQEQEKRAAAAAEKQAQKNEKINEAKKEAIAKGDFKYIKANSKLFSNEEINEAIYRKAMLTKLDDVTVSSNQNGNQSTKDKIDNYAKKPVSERANNMVNAVGKYVEVGANIAKYAKTGLDAYNTIAKTTNAVAGTKLKTFDIEPKKSDFKPSKTVTYDDQGNVKSTTTTKEINGEKVTEVRPSVVKNNSAPSSFSVSDMENLVNSMDESTRNAMSELIKKTNNK